MTCKDCKFWVKNEPKPGVQMIGGEPDGSCFGVPPTPVALMTPQGLLLQSMRPQLLANSPVCGAFQPNESPAVVGPLQ